MQDAVDALYSQLDAVCATYLPEETRARLRQVYEFARIAHGTQTRKSGEPFIMHPITVALYLAELFVDDAILTGALLHDVAEDTDVTLDDIKAEFGAQACLLVDGVTHLKNVSQLEDIAHLFLAMSRDIRVVLIKLYDRLHNLRTLDALPPEHRRRKARETLRIYVPLATKLGMWKLKQELESLSLFHLNPEIYHHICEAIDTRYLAHEAKLQAVCDELQVLMRQYDIPTKVYIQKRSPYRIYEKMTHHRMDEETFTKAFQIVMLVDSVPECYLALGHVHAKYPHIAENLADTIGNPRDIFYRSLHTGIIAAGYNTPAHLRIRTYEFDRLAHLGIVAQIQFARADEEQQPQDTPWLPQLPEIYSEAGDASNFVESVFQDILQRQITCFTPRGREISLPRGATVLDFAYYVHTDIGHECRGAIVNSKPAEIGTKLADGDYVEIIRSRRSGPWLEWMDDTLEYAITSRATSKVREWFRRQDSETQLRRGRELVREERRRLNVMNLTAQRLARDFGLESSRDLYLQIGGGQITVSDLSRAILKHIPDLFVKAEQEYVEVEDSRGQRGWLARMGDTEFRLGRCCGPRVDDEIVGHFNRGASKVVMIHRADCRFIMRSQLPDSLIHMEWLESTDPLTIVYLRLEGYDRGGLLQDISILITQMGASIAQSDIYVNQRQLTFRLKLELQSEDDLIRVMHRLTNLQNVTLVQRMSSEEIQNWDNR